MDRLTILFFWLCALLIAYTYVGYPLAIGLLARWRPRSSGECCPRPESVSFVIAARNEGQRISDRIRELQQQLARSEVTGEIVLVLDGTRDGDVPGLMLDEQHPVQVVPLPQNVGKASAISRGIEMANCEVIALADVRQEWADDALERLLDRFEDSRVGAVSGDLELESSSANQGVGLYWRYEKWIRRQESGFDSVVGVTGAIAAVRRSLFRSIPAGTVLDDVYWPLQVVMQGYRVVHESSAKAYDRLPEDVADEYRRKVRTLAGNFQLMTRLPVAFAPWKNRVWWQLVSRKLLRLVVPWAFLGALFASAAIPGVLYKSLFWLQVVAYSGLVGCFAWPAAKRGRIASAAVSFAMLNFAAWIGFWVWASGRTLRSWGTTQYADTNNSQQRVAGNI